MKEMLYIEIKMEHAETKKGSQKASFLYWEYEKIIY